MVVSIEDNLVSGGLGEKLLGRLAGAGSQVLIFGVRYGFLAQGTREEVLEDLGLTARDIARHVLEAMLQRQVEITQSV
jgi:1-deoxy-D-xylulose-5-phosphate synthase